MDTPFDHSAPSRRDVMAGGAAALTLVTASASLASVASGPFPPAGSKVVLSYAVVPASSDQL